MSRSIFKKVGVFLLLVCLLIATKEKIVFGDASDVAGVATGSQYYIKNVSTGTFLDVSNGKDANGTKVVGYAYHGSSNQKWKLVRITGTTYKMVSVCSGSGRVLDVTGSNLDIWSDAGYSSQKFTLSRNSDGTYYIKYGSKYVVCIGTEVQVSTSTTGAKWSFNEVVKNDADMYGFKYVDSDNEDFNTTGSFSTFKSKYESALYKAFTFTNVGADTAYQNMKSDSIWVFAGHGIYVNQDKKSVPMATVGFFDNKGAYHSGGGYITAHSNISKENPISSLGANALSKAKCIFYLGCGTGVGFTKNNVTYNLVDETYKKGAQFVLGTKAVTYTNDIADWNKKFTTKAASANATIKDCLSYASYYIGDVGIYTKGDINAKLN